MIDEKLQLELRKKYNPEGSDLRKMQLRMLEMLKYIDKICRENDIKYWLSSGTCLGAVRHGGFIPWDDDCDIEMMIDDYRKLIEILKKNSIDSKYKIQDISTDKNYVLPFARLRDTYSMVIQRNSPEYHINGCWIDIFPLENNNITAMKLSAKIHNVLLNCNYKYHIKNRIIAALLKFFFYEIYTPIIRLTNIFSNKNIIHHTFGICFYKARYYEDIKDLIYFKFEDYDFPVPKNYDHYLESLYGNYRSIPVEEHCITHDIIKIQID